MTATVASLGRGCHYFCVLERLAFGSAALEAWATELAGFGLLALEASATELAGFGLLVASSESN